MKINILFDSSFLLHRNLFSVIGSSPNRFFDNEQDASLFVKKLIEDINSIVSIFPKGSLGKLVWAKDSKSWRKELIEQIDYKGTRVRDENKVNWEKFHSVCDELVDVLSQCGFIISSERRAEADDLLYLWSQDLMSKGQSSIIVTSDRDMSQCVRYDGKNFVAIFNPMFKSKKFIFHESVSLKDWKDSSASIDDMFSMEEESPIDRIHKISLQYEQEFINPYEISIGKIFEGDKSDNVPSALQWRKGEKTFSFTKRMVNILMEDHSYDREFIDRLRFDDGFLKAIASHATQIVNQGLNVDSACEAIRNNITLMYLDREIIPSEISVSNFEDPQKRFDLNESKVYEIKPEWAYASKSNKGVDSDIFSMLS